MGKLCLVLVLLAVTVVGLRAAHADDDPGEALRQAHAALAAAEAEGDRNGVAAALLRIAAVKLATGNFSEAVGLTQRAIEIGRALGGERLVARGLLQLGTLRLVMGDVAGASEVLVRALALAEAIGDEDLARRSMLSLAEATRDVALARRLVAERADELSARILPMVLRSSVRTRRPSDALWFIESHTDRALLEAVGGREALRSAVVPRALAERERDAHQALVVARRNYASAVAEGLRTVRRDTREVLDEAKSRWAAAVADVNREAEAAADLADPRPSPLEAVQAVLESDEALVSFDVTNDEAFAVTIEKSRAVVVSLGDSETIRIGARKAREALAHDAEEWNAAPFRDVLFAPLGLSDGVKRLVIVPDDVLRGVPFALLCPVRPTTVVPSATLLVMLRTTARGSRRGVLALGDPTNEDPRLTHLPGTRAEARAVGDVLLIGDAATESAFAKALGTREGWRAVHLASHALAEPEHPWWSSIVLAPDDASDGHLTALEVARLGVLADLVVLSECCQEPTLASNLPVFVDAFLRAGARGVLTSIGPAYDQAALELMQRFYALWNPEEGLPMDAARALRAAQAHVRAQPGWAHPTYWAGWVLYGGTR